MNAFLPLAGTHGFGERLRAWRDGNGFDLDAASRLLGVSDNDLSMIERGAHGASAPLAERFERLVRDLSVFTAPEIAGRIPILSWVQAGRATRYEEMPAGWMDWVDCLCPDPQAFALRVVGDSMSPMYHEGDLVICMPSFEPRNNGLAVAKIQDESVTFKKVMFRGSPPTRFRLVPLNTQYASVVVRRADVRWIYPVHSVVTRHGAA